MKILYYECFSGISGDMNLGAMVDLGVDADYLIDQLSKLNLQEYDIKIYRDSKMGIGGTRVEVIIKDEEHEDAHNHHHRNFEDIKEIITKSALNDKVKNLSLDIFLKVAGAEGKVHGKSISEVHFHEVGAVDSIVDIVGAAICFDYLKVDKVLCSTIEVGSGFVKCAHGVLPVPAPATVEILKGAPTKSERVPFEATTPTGAAILAAFVDEYTDNKSFVTNKVGYGVGKKDGNIPNLLRVFLGEEVRLKEDEAFFNEIKEEAYVLECNIDDMNPENYEYVMDKLFEVGAQDVYLTPIIMKKGRPAVILSVLYRSDIEEVVKSILFIETTTLGIRKYAVEKSMLKRVTDKVNTIYGEVRVKFALSKGKIVKYKFEYEDCKALARENKLPLSVIYEEAEKALKNSSIAL